MNTAFIDSVARHILSCHAQELPDLRGTVVLLPNHHVALPLAHALMRAIKTGQFQCEGEARRRRRSDADSTGSTARSERGSQHSIADAVELDALLLPRMVTLDDWAQSIPLDASIATDSQRGTLLYQHLRRQQWFGEADLWGMAQELLALFDELTQAMEGLPGDADGFAAAVQQAYSARQDSTLQLEARLVFELWHAMQHGDELDGARARQQRLARLAGQACQPLYVLRASDWDVLEQRFLDEYARHAPVTVFDLREMAAQGSAPLFFAATSLEQEARAAAMQVRRWLNGGKRDIAIVAQDRVAARRVRALLERAEILVADETGWTFATLSVSTVLERWLTALQSDFYHHDLLDLLKSPFIFADMTAGERKSAVYCLEQLLRKQGVVAGLEKFAALAEHEATLQPPLARLRQAAAVLEPDRKKTLGEWLAALRESLNLLGIDTGLQQDEAGQQLLHALESWRQELQADTGRYRFAEWRRWLALQLDTQTYRDSGIDSPVRFTHLAATRWRAFDAVLLLGCDAEHLPGATDGGRWFNDAVRGALGLQTRGIRAARQRDDLLALLALNDCVLTTWQKERDGEARLLSPFLQILCDECGQVQGDEFAARELHACLAAEDARTVQLAQAAQPAPGVVPESVPASISISACNALVACPYQFYARHILRLNELDEVPETIEKRDYGEHVHVILQRFHERYPRVGEHRADEMETALRRISEEVFAGLLAQDFAARAWLARWLRSLPAYLEWQLENEAQGWRHAKAESRLEMQLEGVRLHGRIDRLDVRGTEKRVLDYKTQGDQALRNKLKEAGEDVQLACYAGAEEANEAVFVSIEGGKVRSIVPPHDVAQLARLNAERLVRVMAGIRGGAGLPANGIDAVCAYCEVRGVCRKGEWL